ncbi:Rep [Chicken proventriculitis-associated circular virus 14]|nr:Rep [Chicken proventriculitis-associated circular virus 14]
METLGYCLRVQALEGYGLKISSMTLNDDYAALLAVKHEGSSGENPHYHVVVKTKVNAQAFRVRMKKLFPDGKGNQHMSLTSWDGNDKALSYLFHEDPDGKPLARKGVDDEYLARLRIMNQKELTQVAAAKSKASHTLEEDAFIHFQAIAKKKGDSKYIQHKEIVAYMILFALRNGKYPPQAWLCRAMAYKVKFRLLEGREDAEVEYANLLANSLFPD